jgi:hypothetical protein
MIFFYIKPSSLRFTYYTHTAPNMHHTPTFQFLTLHLQVAQAPAPEKKNGRIRHRERVRKPHNRGGHREDAKDTQKLDLSNELAFPFLPVSILSCGVNVVLVSSLYCL